VEFISGISEWSYKLKLINVTYHINGTKKKVYCKELVNKDHTTCGKDLLEPDHRAGPHLRSGSSGLDEMDSGLFRRVQAMGEGDSLWSPIICDQHMEQVNMPGQLSNWKFLSCFASRETIRQGETSREVW
jgi:hypothetical protein